MKSNGSFPRRFESCSQRTFAWNHFIFLGRVNFLSQVESRARLAQSVEHQTFNLRVKGSSPLLGAYFSFSLISPFITLKSRIFASCWFSFPLDISSSVAQWKRAGPITQRSMDRNHPLLTSFFMEMTNFSFFVVSHLHHPLIAQLVERRTVVDCAMQTSLGRWFESGSRDSFSSWNHEKTV